MLHTDLFSAGYFLECGFQTFLPNDMPSSVVIPINRIAVQNYQNINALAVLGIHIITKKTHNVIITFKILTLC